jgi:putative spermidine/putrescine transport system substrate-binding protein
VRTRVWGRIRFLTGVALVALAAVGCGGGSASPGNGSDAGSVVVTWAAGDWGNCQQTSYYDTFTKSTGIQVLHGPQLDDGQIRAQVDAGTYNVDVVYPSASLALNDSGAKYLTKIDYSMVPKGELTPGTYTDYAVGMDLYSWALGYRTDRFAGNKPTSWSDFFDLVKFPGKRAMNDFDVPALLYVALLADGVSPSKVSPIDMTRALKKLDTIKSQIVWFQTGSKGQDLLNSGEVAMAEIYANRIISSRTAGKPVDISWAGQIVAVDYIGIPKGDKNAASAMKLIAWVTRKDINGTAATCGAGLGPTNKASTVDPKVAADLPSSHFDQPYVVESSESLASYVSAHNADITNAFDGWKSK